MDSRPTLIEPGAKYFINQTLKECKRFKEENLTFFFNLGLGVVLVLLVAGFLYANYKGKPTKEELDTRNRQQQQYILSKLQQFAISTHKKNDNLITDLPTWGDHPELAVLRPR